jgi:hypothetical protein
MFDVDVDAAGALGDADTPADKSTAEVPVDPELLPLDTAEPMMPSTINTKTSVRIGCRRNQLFFGLGGCVDLTGGVDATG